MRIEYIQPLVVAWNRTVQDLFKPFRPGRWFAVGFAAWLAALGSGGGGNANIPSRNWKEGGLSEQEARILEQVKDFFSGPAGVSLIVGLVLGLLLLLVVFMWLGSRAQFVFLDQVTGRHWRIADPWQRYATQGNSLFLWRIGFAMVTAGVMLVLIGPAAAYLVIKDPQSLGGGTLLAVAWAVLVVLAVVTPAAFIRCFLNAFVVPLMYREGRKANDAWRRFLPLLRAHTGSFIAYGFFVVALYIGIFVGLFTFSCVTCCIGFCLLAIPYLGTVFTLPIPYTFRGFGPSFLAQFGPDYWSWPVENPDTPIAPMPPMAPAGPPSP